MALSAQYLPASSQLSIPPGWRVVDKWLSASPLPSQVQVDSVEYLSVNTLGQRFAPGFIDGQFQSQVDRLRAAMQAKGQSVLYAAYLISHVEDYRIGPVLLAQITHYRMVLVHTFGPLLELVVAAVPTVLALLAVSYYTSNPDKNPISGPGSIGNQLCQIFGVGCAIQAATNTLAIYLLGGSALGIVSWLVVRELGGKQAAPDLPKPPKLKAGVAVKAGPIHGDIEGGG